MKRACSVASVFLVAACVGSPPESPPCGVLELSEYVTFSPEDRVDLLFVVDDSISMRTEREHLLREIPRIAAIVSSGDRDGDGIVDFMPSSSVHVGVVTSDLGGGATAGGACAPGPGDDGLLRTHADDPELLDCVEMTGGVIERSGDLADLATFARNVRCAAAVGSLGCGVEQPLEAALRALSPDSATLWTGSGYTPPTFRLGDFGHGGPEGANEGFLRQSSQLVVVIVTNEDDCSVRDVGAELASALPGDGDPACDGGTLSPVERFVDGLAGLRHTAALLTVIVVGGVPDGVVDSDFEDLLDAPGMQAIPDPSRPGHLRASCTSADGREATPPRRLVGALAGLYARGATTAAVSLCADSLAQTTDAIVTRIASSLEGSCLPRPLEVDADGRVDCEVVAVLPSAETDEPITHCAQLAGATRLDDEAGAVGGRATTREVCRLPSLGRTDAGSADGWFYDDGDPGLGRASSLPEGCSQRIGLTLVAPASEVRLRCRERLDELPRCPLE